MKMHEQETIAGTQVRIGLRIYRRKVKGKIVKRISKTYSAVFKEVDGKWVMRSLGTTNRKTARRKAFEIHLRLEDGRQEVVHKRLRIGELIDAYDSYIECKGLAPKSLAKYRSDLVKLRAFVEENRITMADAFDEMTFYQYRNWLQKQTHKQGVPYAPKSLHATLTLCKQVFKWAWQRKMMPVYTLASAALPKAKARPQPCFTTEQVELLLSRSTDLVHDAIAILAYSGMRVGELEQLEWSDVLLDRGELGMFHIRRGGYDDAPKDKEARFVPIHPRIAPVLRALPRRERRVLPTLRPRRLLSDLKKLCRVCGLSERSKVHGLRHFFASLCANHQIAYKKALTWLGHSDSAMLSHYYRLHDSDSQSAMQALARDHGWDGSGNERKDRPIEDREMSESGLELADINTLITELGASGKALTEQDIDRLRRSLLVSKASLTNSER